MKKNAKRARTHATFPVAPPRRWRVPPGSSIARGASAPGIMVGLGETAWGKGSEGGLVAASQKTAQKTERLTPGSSLPPNWARGFIGVTAIWRLLL